MFLFWSINIDNKSLFTIYWMNPRSDVFFQIRIWIEPKYPDPYTELWQIFNALKFLRLFKFVQRQSAHQMLISRAWHNFREFTFSLASSNYIVQNTADSIELLIISNIFKKQKYKFIHSQVHLRAKFSYL